MAVTVYYCLDLAHIMILGNNKSVRTLLSLVVLIAALQSTNANALTCARPSLDTAYDNADLVFVARLVSASVSDDFSASGRLVLETTLKGSPPDKLAFDTNIGPLTNCGPDLTVGKAFLVFVKDGKPTLRIINDTASPQVSNATSRWIANKLQTPGTK